MTLTLKRPRPGDQDHAVVFEQVSMWLRVFLNYALIERLLYENRTCFQSKEYYTALGYLTLESARFARWKGGKVAFSSRFNKVRPKQAE